jgi:hypothetical protein
VSLANTEVAIKLITLIGGILGIAATAFIVFDRLWRDRPIFALHPETRVHDDNYLFLHVENVLHDDVVIENWHDVRRLPCQKQTFAPQNVMSALPPEVDTGGKIGMSALSQKRT